MMKFAPPALIAMLLVATPAGAQTPSNPELRLPEQLDETLREMMDQLKPALEDMFRMMEEFEGVDDPRHYMMPEVLPNGDIIIRRRPDAPEFRPHEREEEPEDDGTTKT